jgi:hypothetical protein
MDRRILQAIKRPDLIPNDPTDLMDRRVLQAIKRPDLIPNDPTDLMDQHMLQQKEQHREQLHRHPPHIAPEKKCP